MRIQIDKQQVSAAMAEQASRGASRDEWWPKDGMNTFRLMPFIRGDRKIGAFYREVRAHQDKSSAPTLCGRTPAGDGTIKGTCLKCEEAQRVKQENGEDAAMNLFARSRYVFIVVATMEGGKAVPPERICPRLWLAPKKLGEDIVNGILMSAGDDLGEVLGCEGVDIHVRYDKAKSGTGKHQMTIGQLARSTKLDPAFQDKAQALDPYSGDRWEPSWARAGAVAESAPPAQAAQAAPPAASVEAPARQVVDRVAEAAARLKAEGLDSEWDVEKAPDGRPIFYRKGSETGQWAFPEKTAAPPATPGRRVLQPKESRPVIAADGNEASEG